MLHHRYLYHKLFVNVMYRLCEENIHVALFALSVCGIDRNMQYVVGSGCLVGCSGGVLGVMR